VAHSQSPTRCQCPEWLASRKVGSGCTLLLTMLRLPLGTRLQEYHVYGYHFLLEDLLLGENTCAVCVLLYAHILINKECCSSMLLFLQMVFKIIDKDPLPCLHSSQFPSCCTFWTALKYYMYHNQCCFISHALVPSQYVNISWRGGWKHLSGL